MKRIIKRCLAITLGAIIAMQGWGINSITNIYADAGNEENQNSDYHKSGNLYYSVVGNLDDGYAVIESVENVDEIVIPKTIDGYNICDIAMNCFKSANKVKSLTIEAEIIDGNYFDEEEQMRYSNGLALSGMTELTDLKLSGDCTISFLDLSGTKVTDFSGLKGQRISRMKLNNVKNIDFSTLSVLNESPKLILENATASEELVKSLFPDVLQFKAASSSYKTVKLSDLIKASYDTWTEISTETENEKVAGAAVEDNQLKIYGKDAGSTTVNIIFNANNFTMTVPVNVEVTKSWDSNPALEETRTDISISDSFHNMTGLISANGELWAVKDDFSGNTNKKITDSGAKRYIAGDLYVNPIREDYAEWTNEIRKYYNGELYIDNNDSLIVNGKKVADNVKKADANFCLTMDGTLINHYIVDGEKYEGVKDYVTNVVGNCRGSGRRVLFYTTDDGSLYRVEYQHQVVTSEPEKMPIENVEEIYCYNFTSKLSRNFYCKTKSGETYIMPERGTEFVASELEETDNGRIYIDSEKNFYYNDALVLTNVKQYRDLTGICVLIRTDNTVWYLDKQTYGTGICNLYKMSLAKEVGETVNCSASGDDENPGGNENPGGDDKPGSSLDGDVNADSKVDLKDAKVILKLALGISTTEVKDKDAADYNKDGKVDLKDAKEVLKVALGIKG